MMKRREDNGSSKSIHFRCSHFAGVVGEHSDERECSQRLDVAFWHEADQAVALIEVCC
jgi:hypothetical protein